MRYEADIADSLFRIPFYPAFFSRVARLSGRSINQSIIRGKAYRRKTRISGELEIGTESYRMLSQICIEI